VNAFQPLVSVVIPVYNGANYLASAIESALEQTYPNTEILVIDDGSRDDGATAAVAASFGARISYHRKENGGVSSALNRGLELMRGDYFAWLSHDDRFLREKLAHQVAYLGAHREVEALASGLEVIDANGQVTSSYSCGKPKMLRNGREVMDHWVYGCSLVIHKNVFQRIGGFNETNRTVQDLEMWLKMVYEGIPITMLPAVLCQWRHHGESDSFRQRSAHFAEVDAFLGRIASAYPLEFFGATAAPVSGKEALAVYGWLAQQALKRGCPGRAYAFYKSALGIYPNILDRAFWRVLRDYVASHRRANQVR
jgi:glycosyltransferase involved in cell wall biosynthesis